MHLTKDDLRSTESIKRRNLVNSISGVKPAVLIGTISKDNITNLAIFNSLIHIGSNPAMLGFIIRPDDEVRRHTLENIRHNSFYTINHFPDTMTERAHYTSAKFEAEESEFIKCGFEEEYLFGFEAPFVKESPAKVGLRYLQTVPIEISNTMLIIGEIQHYIVDEKAVDKEGHVDFSKINTASVSGLNKYYSIHEVGTYPYARPHELPDFKK